MRAVGGRRATSGLAVAVGLLAFPGWADAAQFQVDARSDNTFDPADLTVAIGDSVRFTNRGGIHNVKFEDGSFEQPADPSPALWTTPPRTFSAAGTYQYYCEQHQDVGMAGVVRVPAQGTPDTQAPEVTAFALRRAGERVLQVVIRTSEAGMATVRLSRRVAGRYRRVRTVKRAVSAGRNAFKIRRTASGRRLRFGRYQASVEVADAAGNDSERETDPARLPAP
jgi:plastocyanin